MKLAVIALSIGTVLTVEQRDAYRGNLDSASVAVSADGRFVAFTTFGQLVTADGNSTSDVYVLDRVRQHVTLESADTIGNSGDTSHPSISGDGRFVAFERASSVWLRDRTRGVTTAIAAGYEPSISRDGTVVTFSADSFDGLSNDVNGEKSDIYSVTLSSGEARRISVGMPDLDASIASSVHPSTSSDGRYVAFTSRVRKKGAAASAPQVFVRDAVRNITTRVGTGWDPSLSADGRFLAFVDMSNRLANIYLADLQTGGTRLVTTSVRRAPANGDSGRPTISADGRFIAFQSDASNLVGTEDFNLLWDVFVFDRTTEHMVRVSGDTHEAWMEPSGGPSIDGGGSLVAFSSRHPTDASDKKNDFDLYVATMTFATSHRRDAAAHSSIRLSFFGFRYAIAALRATPSPAALVSSPMRIANAPPPRPIAMARPPA
jgi:Tol biopolymer transport system component